MIREARLAEHAHDDRVTPLLHSHSEPLFAHLRTGGVGHISEIADAEAPFAPKGCPFQAWSLGELLRLDRIVLAETKDATRARTPAQQSV